MLTIPLMDSFRSGNSVLCKCRGKKKEKKIHVARSAKNNGFAVNRHVERLPGFWPSALIKIHVNVLDPMKIYENRFKVI